MGPVRLEGGEGEEGEFNEMTGAIPTSQGFVGDGEESES